MAMASNILVLLAFLVTWNSSAAFSSQASVTRQAWRNRSATPLSSRDGRHSGTFGSRTRRRRRRRRQQQQQQQQSWLGGATGASAVTGRGGRTSLCPPLAALPPSSSTAFSSVEDVPAKSGGGGSSNSSGSSSLAVDDTAADALHERYFFASGSLDEAPFDTTAAHLAAAAAAATPPATTAGDREAVFVAQGDEGQGRRGGGASGGRHTRNRSVEPSAGLTLSMRQVSLLCAAAGLVAAAFDYKHGMAGFHWFQDWAGGSAPHFLTPGAAESGGGDAGGAGGGLGHVHLAPLKSVATGLGAGFTRAASRTLTFPLDTIKTRSQLSRLGTEDRALLPAEMRRVIDGPASFEGVFKGFSAFLAQAGPSNAAFFLVYDALNALGTAVLLGDNSGGGGGGGGGGGVGSSSLLPTALHLGASSIATVPANIVRTPAEVVKQRLQVGQESGNSLQALISIVRAEGARGLFVGGKEQLMREIPFNAVQFTVYECLKSYVGGGSELWADAALGAASSAVGALATQPVDTVKTRVMTKSVPGSFGGASPGFVESASLVAEAEGVSALYLGLLPRLVLVSTGGAFYFWGQEFASQLMSRAGF